MAGITSHHVTLEDLLLVQPEAVLGSKDENLVVHGLTCEPFTWRNTQNNSKKIVKNAALVLVCTKMLQ